MGLPLATSAFFLANRLISTRAMERADKEILAFFLTWLCVLIIAFVKRDKLQWCVMAAINSIACFSVPVVNALTTQGNIISYLRNEQWALFMFDSLFLLFGLLFLLQTEKLRTALQAKKPSPINTQEQKV